MVSTNSSSPSAAPTTTERLAMLRRFMREARLDAVVVRSADAYMNEYVPIDDSSRVFMTGFKGSMGDALITHDRALLFVDGRYTLQAGKEAPDFEITVVSLGTSIEEGWLSTWPTLVEQGIRSIGIETDRVPVSLMKTINARAEIAGLRIVPTVPSLVDNVRKEFGRTPAVRKGKFWSISSALSGRTTRERLLEVRPHFETRRLDGFLTVSLDALAWLTNLRGDQFPFQATFRAQMVTLQNEVIVAADDKHLKPASIVDDGIRFVGEGKLAEEMGRLRAQKNGAGLRIGFDPSVTPEHVRTTLESVGVTLVESDDPFRPLRTTKTTAELTHMIDGFRRADLAVKRLQTWLSTSVSRGESVTERDVEKKMEQLLKRQGATGLSFKTIPGAGKNGAIIHYGSPDDKTPIPEGTLFLLDCGAYFEGGYATDLTRTFVVGKNHVKPTDEMKRVFTVVLKGAIAGMSARIPKGATGEQLDAIIRTPIWRAGLNYAHGTGHGVGVNVHEGPPRVAPNARGPVEVDQVFSIEPGCYIEGWGGVRIENLATCVVDPLDDKFLRVKPLTFSPFDERLIDKSMLSKSERAFLVWFKERFKNDDRLDAPLPPLD